MIVLSESSTLHLTNIAMENGPFIDDLLIQNQNCNFYGYVSLPEGSTHFAKHGDFYCCRYQWGKAEMVASISF